MANDGGRFKGGVLQIQPQRNPLSDSRRAAEDRREASLADFESQAAGHLRSRAQGPPHCHRRAEKKTWMTSFSTVLSFSGASRLGLHIMFSSVPSWGYAGSVGPQAEADRRLARITCNSSLLSAGF